MVLCVISGCSSKSGRDKDIRFFRVPKVRTNQGAEHEELTLKRRTEWISAISRGDTSLLAEVSHDVNDGRETSAGFRRVV